MLADNCPLLKILWGQSSIFLDLMLDSVAKAVKHLSSSRFDHICVVVGAGNNPMVLMTVAVAVAIEEASK